MLILDFDDSKLSQRPQVNKHVAAYSDVGGYVVAPESPKAPFRRPADAWSELKMRVGIPTIHILARHRKRPKAHAAA